MEVMPSADHTDRQPVKVELQRDNLDGVAEAVWYPRPVTLDAAFARHKTAFSVVRVRKDIPNSTRLKG